MVNEDVTIRSMVEDDIDGVLRVENDAFTMPWTRTAFVNELTNNQFAHYLVLEVDGVISAYCGLWIVVDEAHITNIAVHSEHRRKHYGEALLTCAMILARTFGAKHMTLEVRVSNSPAQSLYRKLGFQYGGIRRRYYTDNLEDARIMWVNLHEQKNKDKQPDNFSR